MPVQLERLHELGLRVRLLPTLRDVDTPDDAIAVAELVPRSRFGRLHARLVALTSPLDLYEEALSGRRGDRARFARPLPRYSSVAGISRTTSIARSSPGANRPSWTSDVVPAGWSPISPSEASRRSGIDVSPVAVAQSEARGAAVLRRCVEARLPGEGRWGTALLIDGNIGHRR